MLFLKTFLLASVLCVAHAASGDGKKNKKERDSSILATTTTTTNTLSTTLTSTTVSDPSVTALTTSTSETTATKYADLSKRYLEIIVKISAETEKQRGIKGPNYCDSLSCPKGPLDRIVANHALLISNPKKLAEIFSSFMKIFREVFGKLSGQGPDVLKRMFGTMLKYKMDSMLKACANTPERLLSLDFASLPDLSVNDATDYAKFVALFLEQGSAKVSLPAVYLLNAFLQVDSILHHLLLNNHSLEELKEIFDARKDLLEISRKKAHFETVRNLISIPLSRTVRNALGYHSTSLHVDRVLKTVDTIVSKGAIPEYRAYVFAKAASAFLLTEEAVHLEFCNDLSIYQEPYATSDFSRWFTSVLNNAKISLTPISIHSILKSVVNCGNLKAIYSVADFFSARVWSEVFNQMNASEKFYISPYLNCSTYLVMNFLKASFNPLMSEIKTENPILSLRECLKIKPDKQPQCIYELSVRAFATLKFPKRADAVDIKKFLLKDYDKNHFANSGITEKLHANVHDMIIEKLGGEFNSAFSLRLMKIKNATLESFASTESAAYPQYDLGDNIDATMPRPLFGRISEQTLLVRGNDIHKIKDASEEEIELNHIKLASYYAMTLHDDNVSAMSKRFLEYHTIPDDAKEFIKECEDNLEVKIRDPTNVLVGIAHMVSRLMDETPLLLSNAAFQLFFVDMFNQLFECSEAPFFKPIFATFLWDSFAARGIDTSLFINALGLKPGLCMYDLCVLPDISQVPSLDTFIVDNVEKPLYRKIAYMFFSYYMRVVSHSSEEVPSKDYFPRIIREFFGESEFELSLYLRCPMYVAIERLVESSACKNNWKEYVSHLSPFWKSSRLLLSLEMMTENMIMKIGSDSATYGALSLSTLLSVSGKWLAAYIERISPSDSYDFIIRFFENRTSLDDDKINQANSLFSFLGDALAQAPVVIPDNAFGNDPIYMRIQIMFNPYFVVSESDVESYGLSDCITLRKIVHSMVKAIFDPVTPELCTLLTKLLCQHYEKIKQGVASGQKSSKSENGYVLLGKLSELPFLNISEMSIMSTTQQIILDQKVAANMVTNTITKKGAKKTKKNGKNSKMAQIQKQVQKIELNNAVASPTIPPAATTTTNTLSSTITTTTTTFEASATSMTTSTNTLLPPAVATLSETTAVDLNKRYQEMIKRIRVTSAREHALREPVICDSDSCPILSLDQIVANHSIIISDPTKLAEIFSIVIKIIREVFDLVDWNHSMMRVKMRGMMLEVCANTPERLLSLDFASLPDLSLKDAIDYSKFVAHLLKEEATKISLPAVYLLNAVLQVDSMLHHLIIRSYPIKELKEIIIARKDLLEISRKKAHYEIVRNLISVPFSQTVRDAIGTFSTYVVNVGRTLENVDAIVSKGAIPELRAYIFAKAASAFLLTKDVVQLEFCNDLGIYREPYATSDFSLWFSSVLNFVQISLTSSVTHLILKSVISSGNLKCIHKVADFFPASVWSEVFYQKDAPQKFSVSPHLNCHTYLVMCLLKAVFGPLMFEKETVNPVSSLDECLKLKSEQQPQCIYNLIVKSFATSKFPKGSDAVDIKKFLLKDYNKQPFRNTKITEKLHNKVHSMIIEKIGGELDESFLSGLMKVKIDMLEAFARAEVDSYPPKNSVGKNDPFASLPVPESSVTGNISKHSIFLRGNDAHRLKMFSGDSNDLNHIRLVPLFSRALRKESLSELSARFTTYHTIFIDSLDLINQCDEMMLENRTKTGDTEMFVVEMALMIAQFMCERPLLLSSSTSQAVFADLFNQVFRSSEDPFVKPIVAAFLWDNFAMRGMDISFFMNGLGLEGDIIVHDLRLSCIVTNPVLDNFKVGLMTSISYRNFAYMYFAYYMRLVSSSNNEVPVKTYFPYIINKFFCDKDIAPYLRDGVQVALMRLLESTTCKKNWKDYVSHLSPYWNHPLLLQSLKMILSDSIRKISSEPKVFGSLSLSVLADLPGKSVMLKEPTRCKFTVNFFEHGASLDDGDFDQLDNFYAFLVDALARAPFIMTNKVCDNEPVYARLQFLFNPYSDFKECDLVAYGVNNCATFRKVVHSMVKAIFGSATPEIYSLVSKHLYHHFEKIKQSLIQSEMDKVASETAGYKMDQESASIFKQFFNSGVQASLQKSSSGAPQKQAKASNPAAKSFNGSTTTGSSAIASRIANTSIQNEEKPTLSPKVVPIQKQVEQNEPKKEVKGSQKSRQLGKEVEEEEEYFSSTPTPKKTVAEVTKLTSDVASYFEYSSDGIRAPKQRLKKGTHELLLKYANEKGFPFLLDENFYNFLVEGDFRVDTASFGNQLALWKEAKQKVPLKGGVTRLELWVPIDFGTLPIKGTTNLSSALGEFLKEDVELRNRLCSLLQYSMQQSLEHISVKSASIPSEKVKVQNGILFFDSSAVKTLSLTLTKFLTLQPQTPTIEKQKVTEENSSETESQTDETTEDALALQHVIEEMPPAVSSTTTTTNTTTTITASLAPLPSTVSSLQPSNEEKLLSSEVLEDSTVPLSSLEDTSNPSNDSVSSLTTTASVSSTSTSTDNSLTTLRLIDENFMAYEGQLREITADGSTQVSRIERLLKTTSTRFHLDILKKMKAELQNVEEENVVESKFTELMILINDADYIAVDFELTGVSLNNGNDPNGFEECKDSTQQNLIVQVGLMLMSKSKSDRPLQEDSGKSIWRIPVCLNGNTDDSIWRKNSLDFLKSNGFDHLAWKAQCLDYSQLNDIWRALLEKPIFTHNGLLDVLHLLRAAGRINEVNNVHSTDEFKDFLNNAGVSIYDTRVLYNHTHPYFPLTKLSEAVLPREYLTKGSSHDASFDAYLTGHLCRCSKAFSSSSLLDVKNVLLETKKYYKPTLSTPVMPRDVTYGSVRDLNLTPSSSPLPRSNNQSFSYQDSRSIPMPYYQPIAQQYQHSNHQGQNSSQAPLPNAGHTNSYQQILWPIPLTNNHTYAYSFNGYSNTEKQ